MASKANLGGANARSELSAALGSVRGAFVGIGLLSGLLNLLTLTGTFYALEVYGRVLPSRSLPTLISLSIIVAVLFAFQGILELLRSRVLMRIGAYLDEALSNRVFDVLVRGPLLTRTQGDGLQPLRDLDQIRAYFASGGPAALFDLPWVPLFLLVCFGFHFWIGATALAGAAALVGLTVLSEILTRDRTKAANEAAMTRNALAEASRRNTEVVHAMGMARKVSGRWGEANRRYMQMQQHASDVGGSLGAITKVTRMFLQAAVMGVGAVLVIDGQITGGVIFASAILVGRALAPVEAAIGHWKAFVGVRQSRTRLTELLDLLPLQDPPMALPRPRGSFSVEDVSGAPPGTRTLVVRDVSFSLKAGQGLGIVGPSASGKSCLVRLIVGVWPALRGKIRLDGAALAQWDPETLGRHVGYLPQDVELFGGTIAENIARFDPDPDPEDVIAAAQAADVHDMILRLPDGYETQIGEGGAALSGGQRQRIGLARALYGEPFLVVLDEPDSNLDGEGEEALKQAVLGVRARGGIAIVVAHRRSALAGVDFALVMQDGRRQAFGPKDEILARLRPPQRAVAVRGPGGGQALKVVGEGEKGGT